MISVSPEANASVGPLATKAQYEASLAAVHPGDGLPAGQLYHAAGPSAGGWTIVALHDSASTDGLPDYAESQRFTRDHIFTDVRFALVETACSLTVLRRT